MVLSILTHKSHSDGHHGKKGFFSHMFHRHHGSKNKKNHDRPESPTAPPSRENTCSTCGTSNHQACKCLVKGNFSSIGAECEEEKEIAPISEQQKLRISSRNVVNEKQNEISGIVVESHANHYSNIENLKVLQEGGVLFSFSCPHPPNDFEQSMLNSIANLTSFQDEAKENHVPVYVPGDDYTFVLSTCSYLLPGVDIDRLCNPEFLASQEYHKACQPIGTVVWDSDKNTPTTFRITKPVIPYIFNLTVQFKVSKIEKEDIDALSSLLGTHVDCGLLLERTKRNSKRQDSTKKAKSVLLYTIVECGVLVHHITVILQSSLPLIIAMGINKFGAWGLNEACETVQKTRKYTRGTIPMQDDCGLDD